MKDIENRKDIEFIIDSFYEKAVKDDVIGFFFTDIVKLSFEKHIPVMYDFWETTLFGTKAYDGNPMLKHIELNKKAPLKNNHFKRWIQLWGKTINTNFEREKAYEAITRAKNISELIKYKIANNI